MRRASKKAEKSDKGFVVLAASCVPFFYMASDGLARFSDIVFYGTLEANLYAVVPVPNISSGIQKQVGFKEAIAAHCFVVSF